MGKSSVELVCILGKRRRTDEEELVLTGSLSLTILLVVQHQKKHMLVFDRKEHRLKNKIMKKTISQALFVQISIMQTKYILSILTRYARPLWKTFSRPKIENLKVFNQSVVSKKRQLIK